MTYTAWEMTGSVTTGPDWPTTERVVQRVAEVAQCQGCGAREVVTRNRHTECAYCGSRKEVLYV